MIEALCFGARESMAQLRMILAAVAPTILVVTVATLWLFSQVITGGPAGSLGSRFYWLTIDHGRFIFFSKGPWERESLSCDLEIGRRDRINMENSLLRRFTTRARLLDLEFSRGERFEGTAVKPGRPVPGFPNAAPGAVLWFPTTFTFCAIPLW